MNRGPFIFLGIFFALALSWYGMIFTPQLQLGGQQPVAAGPENPRYPLPRPGLAQQGREVYRANGCFYCHTQQARESAVRFDVVLVSAGTNTTRLINALLKAKPELGTRGAAQLIESTPKVILEDLEQGDATFEAKRLSVPDAKIDLVMKPQGADIERGWGKRFNVAQDYLYEQPLMLGSLRVGPDLANVGLWRSNEVFHFLHLYNPQITAKGSTMPPYRFLFEKRKIRGTPSPEALPLVGKASPGDEFQIVPKSEARALVAYLMSLRSDAPLLEAPLPRQPKPPGAEADTNQPPATVATNTAATATPGQSTPTGNAPPPK